MPNWLSSEFSSDLAVRKAWRIPRIGLENLQNHQQLHLRQGAAVDFFPTDGCHRTKVGFVRCASLKNNARIRGWISGYTNPVDSRLILQKGDVGAVHIIQFA